MSKSQGLYGQHVTENIPSSCQITADQDYKQERSQGFCLTINLTRTCVIVWSKWSL